MGFSEAGTKKLDLELGVVMHACNPSLGVWRQEDQELKASLGYLWKFRPDWVIVNPVKNNAY